MAVIVSNGDTTLNTASGFYGAEAYNIGTSHTTTLTLSSTRTIPVTFAHAGNCQGVILGIRLSSNAPATYKSVLVELQEYIAPTWTTQAAVTVAATTLANGVADPKGVWLKAFTGGTFPYAVDTTASKWRFQISQSGVQANNPALQTSDGTNPFYVTWCDNAATFADNDCVICKDVVTVDKTATVKGVLGTGDTARGVAMLVCSSSSAPTLSNTVGNLAWGVGGAPAASYTLTVDGVMVLGAHSGIRVGDVSNAIPLTATAIFSFPAPSVGTFSGIISAATVYNAVGYYGYKESLICYGTAPASPYLTLTSNAAAGQADIQVGANDWSNGDTVFVGKLNDFGARDVTARTISAGGGTTTFTLSSNLSKQRLAGGTVARIRAHSIQFLGLQAAASAYLPANANSNYYCIGCYFENMDGVYVGNQYNAGDDAANRSTWTFQDSMAYATYDTGKLVGNAPIDGILFSRFIAVRAYTVQTIGATNYTVPVGSYLSLQNSRFIGIVALGSTTQPSNLQMLVQNCVLDGAKDSGSIALGLSGIGCIFQDNTFWGNTAGVQYGSNIKLAAARNTYDKCTTAMTIGGVHVESLDSASSFGAAAANTTDVILSANSYLDFELASPVGNLVLSLTNLPNTLNGTHFKIDNFNSLANDDRGYLTYGYLQRTGSGLTDTTVHTAGAGKFAIRFESSSSANALQWSFIIPTGDISTKTMTIAVWVKISNAAYYGGTHADPSLSVNYDNGTTLSAAASHSTDWQLLAVNFTPATTYGQVTVTLSTRTDQTGANAYVYWDDFAILYPAGYALNLGGMDLWANALPVVPPIDTVLSAEQVWTVQTATLTGAGSIGKYVVDNLNAPVGSIPTNPLLTTDARLNNLDATISSRGTADPGDAMALTVAERNSIAAALLDLANGIETGVTLRQAQRLELAALAGKLSGAPGGPILIRDVNDTKNRINATVDANGNRTNVVTDGT